MSLRKPDNKLFFLAEKWLSGTITENEMAEFDQWYQSFDDTYHEVDSDEGEPALQQRLRQSIFVRGSVQLFQNRRMAGDVYV